MYYNIKVGKIHKDFRKGQRIVVMFRNGEKAIDKYVKTTSMYLFCENARYSYRDIRFISINKRDLNELSRGRDE